MIKVFASARNFLKDESGFITAENIVWLVLGVLASSTIALGMTGVLRGKTGDAYADMKSMQTVATPVTETTDYGVVGETGSANDYGRTGVMINPEGKTR